MIKIYKKISLLALVCIIGTGTVQAKEIKNDTDAILALGGQMSNVRAMLEGYTMIGAQIKFQNPKKELKENMQSYENVLNDLEKNFKDQSIQETVKNSRTSWKPVKEALLTALQKTDRNEMRKTAQFVHDNVRSVIQKLGSMKNYFLEKDKATNSKALNAAIEIAASARRLSAHYMMKMWGLPDPTIEKHWNKGVKIYKDSIALLKKSPYYKDAAFKSELDKTDKILKYLVMTSSLEGTFMPSMVHDKCEKAYGLGSKMAEQIAKGK